MTANMSNIISIAAKRKGKASILDAMIHSLMKTGTQHSWPELYVSEITEFASREVGRTLPTETIRAYIHKERHLFEKVSKQIRSRWRLSKYAVDLITKGERQ